MKILFISVFIIFFIINTLTYKKMINFVNIINCLWTFFSMISMDGNFEMFIPPKKTYIYILVFWSFFQIFCFGLYKN